MTPDNDAMRALKLIENELREAHADSDMTDNYVSRIEAAFKTIRTALQRSSDFDKLHDHASNNVTELEMQIMHMKAQVDGLVQACTHLVTDLKVGEYKVHGAGTTGCLIDLYDVVGKVREALQQFSAKDGQG